MNDKKRKDSLSTNSQRYHAWSSVDFTSANKSLFEEFQEEFDDFLEECEFKEVEKDRKNKEHALIKKERRKFKKKEYQS